MKILDKLKNALFEEEYVEIEEKPKKVKPEKQKKEQPKKDSFHKEEKKFVEEKPIAKRIVPTEKKENSVEKEEKNEFIRDNEFTKPKEEPKFTIVTDEDLTVDDTKYQKPPVEKEIISHKTRETIKREELYNNKEQKEPEVKLYQAKKTESYLDNYTPHEYGKYEKKKEKEVFKPSPIISPIYGIVSDTDQDIREQKQEIRLTSAISHEKMDLDEIRKKAFGDLTDDLKDNINYIIHTAAVTTSKLMVQKPVDTLMTAINGTKAILDMAKEKDLESIVYLSSMEVYGSFNDEKYVTEDTYGNIDILDVRSSYSEGKRVCENMCISYYHQYNIPVKIARLAQTFGPGISKDDNRVYAQFARSVLERKDIVLHTDGLSEGNYVYISDAVDAIIKLLILGQNGEAYNIANEQSHMQIRKMAEMVAEKVAKGNIKVAYELQSQNAYAKDTRMKMNTDKIKKIGWNPEISLYDTYIRMIDYIKELK